VTAMRWITALLGLLGVVTVAACTGKGSTTVEPEPEPDAQREPASPRRATLGASLSAHPCDGHDGLVLDPIDPIIDDWQGAVTVGGRGPVIVRWCGMGTVTLVSVTVLRASDDGSSEVPLFIRELDPSHARLEPGASQTLEIGAPAGNSRLAVLALAVDASGLEHRARATLHTLEDPERLALRGACEDAGGKWGARGLAGREQCDKPTRDAGQRCTSRADCEGPCIHDATEPLTDAAPDGVEIPACGPGQQPHLRVGHCHERSVRFGCHPRLDRVTIECLAPGFAKRLNSVCVD
jgi:hypothetical protein